MPAKAMVGGDVRTPAGSRSLAAYAAKVARKYGEENVSNGKPPVICSTGSIWLDWALRVGGLQVGRVYEILGPKDSAKSTLGISAMIQFRLMFPDRGVGYVNMENTFSPKRARLMGLDCSKAAKAAGIWFPMLPANSEQASDMARDLVGDGFCSIVVVDSVGAMESKRVLDKEAEKAADSVGRNAKIITQMTKDLSSMARINDCTVLLINQPRANIGGMGAPVSAGPMAMQHSTTAKIEMRGKGGEEDIRKLALPGDHEPQTVSFRTVAKVTRMKNGLAGRVAEPFVNRVASDEYGPPGFDDADSYLSLGMREKAVTLGGSYYTFPDGHRENGRISAATYLRSNPGACKAIRASLTFDDPIDDLEDDY
jgi:RecA/RadA recombinase